MAICEWCPFPRLVVDGRAPEDDGLGGYDMFSLLCVDMFRHVPVTVMLEDTKVREALRDCVDRAYRSFVRRLHPDSRTTSPPTSQANLLFLTIHPATLFRLVDKARALVHDDSALLRYHLARDPRNPALRMLGQKVAREEAAAFVGSLSATYSRIVSEQRARDGLLVVRGLFGDRRRGRVIDVTQPLQTMVSVDLDEERGVEVISLRLPGGKSFATLPGFFEPAEEGTSELEVKYIYHGGMHESRVADGTEFRAPLRRDRIGSVSAGVVSSFQGVFCSKEDEKTEGKGKKVKVKEEEEEKVVLGEIGGKVLNVGTPKATGAGKMAKRGTTTRLRSTRRQPHPQTTTPIPPTHDPALLKPFPSEPIVEIDVKKKLEFDAPSTSLNSHPSTPTSPPPSLAFSTGAFLLTTAATGAILNASNMIPSHWASQKTKTITLSSVGVIGLALILLG